MRKKIIKIGSGQGIYFTLKELEAYGLMIGDYIDLSDIVKVNPVLRDEDYIYINNEKGGKS